MLEQQQQESTVVSKKPIDLPTGTGPSLEERRKLLTAAASTPTIQAKAPPPPPTGGMSMAERMASLAASAPIRGGGGDSGESRGGRNRREDGDGGEGEGDGEGEGEGGEGREVTHRVQRSASRAHGTTDDIPRPMIPGLGGGPKPAEPEQDSVLEEVHAAPQMAMRTARRPGARRPNALADLDD
jgi:hypothetical protein